MPCQCQTPVRGPCWFCWAIGLLQGISVGFCTFSIWLNWESAPPGPPRMVRILSHLTRAEEGYWVGCYLGSTTFEWTDTVERFSKCGYYGEVGDVFCWENCD